jgi:hypothetical protein
MLRLLLGLTSAILLVTRLTTLWWLVAAAVDILTAVVAVRAGY